MVDTPGDEFRRDGFLLIPNVYNGDLLSKLRVNIDNDLEDWSAIMADRGRLRESGLVAHHVLTKQHWVDFLDLLEPYEFFCQLLNSLPVVSAFGVLDNCRTDQIYVHQDHIDQRFRLSTSESIMLNLLIFIDEFTPDTGATFVYPKSHLTIPSNHFDSAQQICGPAGSILIWDSRLLHRAGRNIIGRNRRAISLMLTRPWLKPQFDYSSFVIRNSMNCISDKVSQLLGLKCRVPQSLDDWYPMDGVRKYEQGQDDWLDG